MKNLHEFLLLSVMGISSISNAAVVFVNDGQGDPAEFTVRDYRFYYDGSNAIFEVRVKENVSIGCASADAGKVFSYWVPSGNAFQQILQAQVASADAQGRKINVQYDNARCGSTAGAYLYGIRVLEEGQ